MSETMRDIIETINKMIDVLPDSKEESELVKDLNSLKTSCVYSAPEMITYRWGQLASTVNEWMPKLEHLNDWQKKFVSIFIGKEL